MRVVCIECGLLSLSPREGVCKEIVPYKEDMHRRWDHRDLNGCVGRMISLDKVLHAFKPHGQVDYNSPDDMNRFASLYTHDMARPGATDSEIVLGNCIHQLWAAHHALDDTNGELRDEITRLRKIEAMVNQLAKSMGGGA